ncbi:MAG: 4Fe-4S dicluster domain-containing protein [Promethearchaeota archaeon]
MEPTELLEKFEELLEVTKLCYQCGTCAGGCPVFRQYPNFNPRRVMEKLLMKDFSEQLFDDQQIWYCSMCYTCSVRCPQGIDIGHVITEIKNLAVQMKNAPPGIIAEMEAIMETGVTAAISKGIMKRREQLELPELPPPNLDEIRKIFEVTGAAKYIKEIKEIKEETS